MSLSQEKRDVIHLFPHCAKDRLAGDDKLQVCSGCSTPLFLLKSHNEIEDFFAGNTLFLLWHWQCKHLPIQAASNRRTMRKGRVGLGAWLHLRIIPVVVSSTHHHQSDRRRFGSEICDYCKSLPLSAAMTNCRLLTSGGTAVSKAQS